MKSCVGLVCLGVALVGCAAGHSGTGQLSAMKYRVGVCSMDMESTEPPADTISGSAATSLLRPQNWSPPEYPRDLRDAHVQGRVLTRFVIDTTGALELPSLAVIASTHADFSRVVCESLLRARFAPVQRDGRPVRIQVLDYPFVFRIRR